MSSVTGLTIASSHRGLSKVLGTPTEVTADIKNHYAGETVEWVNHTVHQINKQGDTVYGDLLMNGTKQVQFGTTATAIYDNAGALTFKDAGAGTKTLSQFVTTATKLDDLATPDDNTDLNATTTYHGLLPKLDGNANNFLTGVGAWATPAGGGNVSNASTVTDNTIARYDGTSGTNVQPSLVSIDDSGSVNIPTGQTYKINGTSLNATAIGLGNVTNNEQVRKIASSTDNAIVRWDSTTGAVVQNSSATMDDSGSINIPSGQTYKINGTALAKGDIGLGNVDNFGTASQAEAEAGVANNRFMTPERTKQAIDYRNIGWHLYSSTAISTASGTYYTAWQFATENLDTSGFHAGTNDYVTIPTGLGGWYEVGYYARSNFPASDGYLTLWSSLDFSGVSGQKGTLGSTQCGWFDTPGLGATPFQAISSREHGLVYLPEGTVIYVYVGQKNLAGSTVDCYCPEFYGIKII